MATKKERSELEQLDATIKARDLIKRAALEENKQLFVEGMGIFIEGFMKKSDIAEIREMIPEFEKYIKFWKKGG